jgi:hypothetical protein
MEDTIPTNLSLSTVLNHESETLGKGPVLEVLEGYIGARNNDTMGRLPAILGGDSFNARAIWLASWAYIVVIFGGDYHTIERQRAYTVASYPSPPSSAIPYRYSGIYGEMDVQRRWRSCRYYTKKTLQIES